MNNVEKIKNININGKEFTVLRGMHNGKRLFATVEPKYITDGRLNQTLNGLHTLPEATLEKAISKRKQHIEIYEEGIKSLKVLIEQCDKDSKFKKEDLEKILQSLEEQL